MSKYTAKEINGQWYLINPDGSKTACVSEYTAKESARELNRPKKKAK